MTDDRIARLRREYEARGLVEGEMAADPTSQFEEWFSAVGRIRDRRTERIRPFDLHDRRATVGESCPDEELR